MLATTNAYQHKVEAAGVEFFPMRPHFRSPEQVVNELRQLLEVPQYQARAEAVAVRVRAENGVEQACDAIERLWADDPLSGAIATRSSCVERK